MRLLNHLNPQQRHRTLDVIRGLAVLLVFFAHLDNYSLLYIWPLSAQPLQMVIGRVGYYLFFLLSGYLIWASAEKTLQMRNGVLLFFSHRITRICPIYFFSIGFIVLFEPLFIGYKRPEIDWYIIARHLSFSQGLQPIVSDALNTPFWTLTQECLFYLFVPLLFALKPSNRFLTFTILISQILWLTLSAHLNGFTHFWALFCTGILMFKNQGSLRKTLSICLIYIGLVLFFAYPKNTFYQMIFVVGLFNLLLNFNFSGLLFKPLAGLGVISYSVYIWHAILIHLVTPYILKGHLLVPVMTPWLPYGIYWEALLLIAGIIGFSTITYLFIEKPSMTKLRIKLINIVDNK